MPISSEVARARAAIGGAVVRGDHEAEMDARRDLRAALLAERVRAVVSELPPLTDEQRDQIAALLRGGA